MIPQFIFLYCWVIALLIFSYVFEYRREECVCGKLMLRCNPWVVLLALVPLVIAVGPLIMADKVAYMHGYLNVPDSIKECGAYLSETYKDKGFSVFALICKQLFGNNYKLYFILIALIQATCVLYIFRKYSCDFFSSFFLFIAGTDYIAWMCNGIRQFLAVAIIFAATPWMLKKKYPYWIAVVLLASTFHQSALIMLPFVWIANGKAWNWKTLLLILFTVLSVLFIARFTGILDVATSGTQYAGATEAWLESGDDGVHPLRVILYSIPAAVAFLFRGEIQELSSPIVNFCTNMAIISMCIWVIGMFTSGIYVGRLPIYALLYGYILLPWEIHNLCGRNTKFWLMGLLVAVYTAFYFYSLAH